MEKPKVNVARVAPEKPIVVPNPRKPRGGRPKGSKNKTTLLSEIVRHQFDTCLAEKFPEVLARTLELADKGNTVALKILWDRLLPAKKMGHEKNEGQASGISITINAIPGPEGGTGVTIEGEKANGKQVQVPNPTQHPGKHLQRHVSTEKASTVVEARNANPSEVWQERED